MQHQVVKSVTVKPRGHAVKAERGQVAMWVVGQDFGLGSQPMQNPLGHGQQALSAALEGILLECIGVVVTEYEGQDG